MQVNSTPIRKIAVVVAILASVFLLWYFSTIVVYIVIALFLSLLGRPIQALLRKIKIGKWSPGNSLVATITLVILFAVFGGFFYLITPVLIGQMANISTSAGIEVNGLMDYPFQYFQSEIDKRFPDSGISFAEIAKNQIAPLFSIDTIKHTIGSLAQTTVDLAVGIFCVAFILFFFLQDEKMFSRWIMLLIPEKYEENMLRVMDSIYILQIRYLVGITIESIIKFLILWSTFWIAGLHVDTAMVAAVLCAILNVIPYIGPIIGGIIAMFLGFVSAPAGVSVYTIEIVMLVALIVFQLIDNILLQPYIYASSVKAHPLEIFIVILMAGYIGGIIGMLVAIPVYTILRVLAKEFLGKYKVVRELTVKL